MHQVFMPIFFLAVCCSCGDKLIEPPEPTAQELAQEQAPAPVLVAYTALPDQPEWTVSFGPPLVAERQEIQSAWLPDPVWHAFPLPEFAGLSSRSLIPLTQPGSSVSGYGMDSMGCSTQGLIASNGIDSRYGWGVSGGQYGYFRVTPSEDHLLYDPRDHGFLIKYQDAYLVVTFPDASTMHMRRLIPPDTTDIRHCGPGDDWQKRFEDQN